MLPLVAHRLFEYLAVSVRADGWRDLWRHLLPPSGMIGASLAIWRTAPLLPGSNPKLTVHGSRALAAAAGLLLGVLAASANLLYMVAGAPSLGALSCPGALSATAAILHILLLAPVGEELAFRGLIYRHLRRGMPPLVAGLTSASIFSVMHGTLHQSCFAFLLGGMAAFSYEQTRSLLAPVLIHCLFNAVPVGFAAVRYRPGDVGGVWLVLLGFGFVFTVVAHSASKASSQSGG